MIKIGSRVRHPEYGVGTLLGYSNSGNCAAVEFDTKRNGHDCYGNEQKLIRLAKKGRGWWVNPDELTPLRHPKKRKAAKMGKSKAAKSK